MSDGYFDEEIASSYDDDHRMSAADVARAVVDVLTDLAGTGSALEFGDFATQRVTSHHLRITQGRTQRFSMPFRYVWPTESTFHVSVWEEPAGGGRDEQR